MKRILALLMTVWIATVPAMAQNDPVANWAEYDALISAAQSEADLSIREVRLHQAEDMLMETGAVVPIYYRNTYQIIKPDVQGVYTNAFGVTYFHRASRRGGDALRANLYSEPDKLDPALITTVDGACLARAGFGGLYTFNAQGEVVPDFATGHEVSEDGLTYTFTMREGLKWSDGSELNARDFEYSWKRAADPRTGSDHSDLFSKIAGYPDRLAVTASPDGRTLTVKLVAPCPYLLDLMAYHAFFAVPRASVEGAKNWQINPGAWCREAGFVSSGPFVLTEWVHDEYMVYTKNPNYWDAENVKLQKLRFMLSGDNTAVYTAYQAGDLDFMTRLPNDVIGSMQSRPDWHTCDAMGIVFICFNVKSPMFRGKTPEQAVAMRKAISMLIDRQYIVETVGQCNQKLANGFVPVGMSDGHGGVFKANDGVYNYPVTAVSEAGDELPGYYDFEVDVEGAVALLKQAGFEFNADNRLSPRTPLSFEYLTNEDSTYVATAECIQQDLAAVGINMTIRTCDWNVFLGERKNGRFDVARHGWVSEYNDPINLLDMWVTHSGMNICQFGR